MANHSKGGGQKPEARTVRQARENQRGGKGGEGTNYWSDENSLRAG